MARADKDPQAGRRASHNVLISTTSGAVTSTRRARKTPVHLPNRLLSSVYSEQTFRFVSINEREVILDFS